MHEKIIDATSDSEATTAFEGENTELFKEKVYSWVKEGEELKEVYENYKKVGVKDIELKLYQGGRHEMLNELNKAGFDLPLDALTVDSCARVLGEFLKET